MKVIRVKLHQETANYRVPASHGFRESYPLPPISTVIGMVHYLCDFHEYHPMKVSVQGSYVSTTSDFFTRYEFKNGMKFDPGRHQLNAEGYGISRGIGHVQLLYDVNLILHIKPDDENELEDIYNALKYPREFPNLGRREDLANFEEVKIVDVEKKDEDLTVNHGAYIPVEMYENIGLENEGIGYKGTHYYLNKDYKLVTIKKGQTQRRWNKVEVIYASGFTVYKCYVDEVNNVVFLV